MSTHASVLTAVAKIQPIEFQNQWAELIRILTFSPIDGRPHPVSGSMDQYHQLFQRIRQFWSKKSYSLKLEGSIQYVVEFMIPI